MFNGHLLCEEDQLNDCVHVDVNIAFFGGKGGFGSMLRAIGAQIEKTTNREACRDLSGRRLRDINEEKRIKNWIAKQADKQKDNEKKKKEKLEKLKMMPKCEFNDTEYVKNRSEIPEIIDDALQYGLQVQRAGTSKSVSNTNEPIASTSTSTCTSNDTSNKSDTQETLKRKADDDIKKVVKKNKHSLWLGFDFDEEDIDEDEENEEKSKAIA